MEFQYVRAFLEVGKFLNFTKAATSLGITQAAVSRQIKLLEESMSEQLVIRSPQKVTLTPRGQILFDILSTTENQLTTQFFAKKTQVIRLGIIEGVLINWFIDRLHGFFKQHNYNFKIEVDRSARLTNLLENSKLDLLISSIPIETGTLTSQRLFKENYILISKKPLDDRKLEDHTWITYSDSDPLATRKKKSKRYISVNSLFSMYKLVEQGLGIAVIPSHCLPSHSKLFTKKWTSQTESIYLTTQNYSIIPQWLKDVQEKLI